MEASFVWEFLAQKHASAISFSLNRWQIMSKEILRKWLNIQCNFLLDFTQYPINKHEISIKLVFKYHRPVNAWVPRYLLNTVASPDFSDSNVCSVLMKEYILFIKRPAVVIATDWTTGVRFPEGERFISSPQRSDRFWDPPSLLSYGHGRRFSSG
jgi:hypothetical protein